MKLVSIEIEGFRSFRGRQRFAFEDRAGLFLVQGKNQVEPDLGANGAGKSTFWDAVCWCLYGKTARGLSGPQVESWKGKHATRVALQLEIDGNVWSIERMRQPIHLWLEGEDVPQTTIDDLLSMGYQRFLQVVLMGQFGTLFPDMKPTSRLDLLTDVLDLQMWVQASQQAKQSLGVIEEERHAKEGRLRDTAGRLAAYRDQREALQLTADEWAADQQAKVIDLGADLARAEDAHHDELAKLDPIKSQLSAAIEALGKVEEERSFIVGELDEIADTHTKVHSELLNVQTRVDECSRRLEEVRNLDGPCPTCNYELSGKDKKSLIRKLTKSLERTELEEKDALGDAQEFDAQRNSLKSKLTAATDKSNATSRVVEDARRALRAQERKVDQARMAQQQADRDYKRSEDEEDPTARQLDELDEKILDLEESQYASQAHFYDSVTQYDLLREWPKLFKELRLWVIEQALHELEIHVNSALVELGLREWSIEFSVERETQSGSVSRGFEIMVSSPSSPDVVPWESWSGGETQRLRIACAVGIANLIRSRMPSAPDLEVWDEPTAHLNEDGVSDLLSFMNGRADSRQIWVVDHRQVDSGAFDQTLTVVKTAAGSKLEF